MSHGIRCNMANIIENLYGRRIIKMSTDDVISIVREYQNTAGRYSTYKELRKKLDKKDFYIPEDKM